MAKHIVCCDLLILQCTIISALCSCWQDWCNLVFYTALPTSVLLWNKQFYVLDTFRGKICLFPFLLISLKPFEQIFLLSRAASCFFLCSLWSRCRWRKREQKFSFKCFERTRRFDEVPMEQHLCGSVLVVCVVLTSDTCYILHLRVELLGAIRLSASEDMPPWTFRCPGSERCILMGSGLLRIEPSKPTDDYSPHDCSLPPVTAISGLIS